MFLAHILNTQGTKRRSKGHDTPCPLIDLRRLQCDFECREGERWQGHRSELSNESRCGDLLRHDLVRTLHAVESLGVCPSKLMHRLDALRRAILPVQIDVQA